MAAPIKPARAEIIDAFMTQPPKLSFGLISCVDSPSNDLMDFLFTLYVNAGNGPRINDGVDAPSSTMA
jgi:hypothetical protein